MKLKKFLTLLLFFIVFENLFAQINPPIPNPKKITFVYKTNPNVFFDDDNLYADTLIFKALLPKLKYQLAKYPKDSTKIYGSIKKEQIKPKYLRELRGFISHNCSTKEFVYSVKEKKSTVVFTPSTKECEKFFMDFFKEPFLLYSNATRKQEHLFDDENKKITTKTIYSSSTNSYSNNLLKWYPNLPEIGSFVKDDYYNSSKETLAVITDQTLDKHITPISLFGNCNFGVTNVVSRYYTTYLVSVSYE
jgi:hypothetical protein